MPTQSTATPAKQVVSLPSSQVNLAALSKIVLLEWQTKFPTFSVTFVSIGDFAQLSNRFSDNVESKRTLLAKRKVLSQALQTLSIEMDKNVKFLKSYLNEEFGANAVKSYYNSFGIITESKRDKLPADKDKRVLSLKSIVAEMTNNTALGSRKFGLAYWTEQLNTLELQWQLAKTIDSDLGTLTDALHTDMPVIKTYLSKIKQQVKLNSGTTYKQVWREWGFQSEKYK